MNKGTPRFGLSTGVQTLLLFIILCALIILATGSGYIDIRPSEVVEILFNRLTCAGPAASNINETFQYVIFDVRLPRIITSAIVGAGLAVAGVIFQGILLNPLADPYTLGVSAGAAFGASLAILFNFEALHAVSISAFIGSAITLAAVLALSNVGGQIHSGNLILSGVIVAAILSAGLSFLKYLADEKVSVIIFWLMGSFASKTWPDVLITFSSVIICAAVSIYYAGDLNILSLGRRSADSLGVESNKVRAVLLITASLMTAVCVSVSGIIGFIGLIVPHLMRFIVGPDNRVLIPVSALAGAILLLGADTVTRVLFPGEIPIGVLTAMIGGPVFCIILRRRQMRRIYE